MTEQERDKILLTILEKTNELQETVGKVQAKVDTIEEKVNILDKKIDALERRVESLEKRVSALELEVAQLKKDVKWLKEEVEKLSQSIARIEVEHGEKISILLDVTLGHNRKFEIQQEKIEKNEKILEKHGHQIYWLEQEVKNKN